MTQLLFVNVGWMIEYAGLSASDPTLGGFGHLKHSNIGYETWNFVPRRGKLYGYVPRSARINLARLGGLRSSKSISGITVVWLARNPRNRRTYIVGWYRDATVYRDIGHVRIKRERSIEVDYHIEAPADKAKLLKVDARVFLIPTAKEEGNLGQSPIWYGKDDNFRKDVAEYIDSGGKRLASRGAPSQSDPELRRKIERAAIQHATAYFKSPDGGNHAVRSVEADNLGWDLEATSAAGEILKIEVKGLSGSALMVELTPNEYNKMNSKEHRSSYIIYIVTTALEDPSAHVFRHDLERSTNDSPVWISDDGRELDILPVVAARLSASTP
ncbi:DUF3883 domain-containing protein [Kaistia adipata]|uniref:DUF3883 domain-containing protein n=1 Tax=Kaistia adipata TaxID=166954 RepID=UPI000A01E3DB|nr:DUF3883 domain-containing protein [Kaistia adipata]